MKKRILAFLLATIMVLSLLPTVALAEGETTTLPKAVDNVITLTEDVTLSSPVDISETTTLDLNGHTIRPGNAYASDYLIAVLHGGNLTVKDSSDGKTGVIDFSSIENNDYTAIKMTKKDGDSTNQAKLTVESGTIKGYAYAISGNGNTGRENTAVEIKGGKIIATKEVADNATEAQAKNVAAIYQPQNGSLTVSGGEIEGAVIPVVIPRPFP